MVTSEDPDIAAARSGDRAALDRVLSRLQERLERTVRQRMGAPLRRLFNTSDLFQSAMIDVVRGIGGFQGQDQNSLVGWVVAIIDRTIQDRLRWLQAGKRSPDHELTPRRSAKHISDLASPGTTLSRSSASREELELVRRALASLPTDQKRALELRVFEGKSPTEIAQELARSAEATRSLLLRSRAALLRQVDSLRRREPPNQ